MKKLILALFVVLAIQSCNPTPEEVKIEKFNRYNRRINDTCTLNDGHIYYIIYTHTGSQPIHSQYCKNH